MRTLAIVFSLLALATAGASADTFRPEPNVAIQDSSAAGTLNTLSVATSCTLNDVTIALEIDHTWVGDLVIRIVHAGTTVIIVDRPGRAPGGLNVGCGADMACTRQVVLDDDGGGSAIECAAPSACSTCFPPSGTQVPAATFIPNEVLAAFIGAEQAGDWTIQVSDMEPQDNGTLCAWEVRTGCGPAAVEPATWGKIKARYQK
jgi:subtilisin-like proprotein convertase family protein